jgi:hypothetical protein
MDATTAAAGCCCCVVFIGLIIVIACSFSSLHQTQYGLDYNHIFETIDSKVYTGGLHFLGIGHGFVKFPNTVQSVVYSQAAHDRLHARTSDGLPLILGVSFQYRLDVKNVYGLYMKYKDSHSRIVFNTGKHLVSNGAANYTAYEFFNNKQGIAKDMQLYLNDYLQQNLFCFIDAFQINTVHLPSKFEDAIQHSLNTKQNITRTQKVVENVKVMLKTQILVAEKNANSTIAQAKGQASAVLQAAYAASNMTKQTVRAASKGYLLVKDSLKFKGATKVGDKTTSEMLSYIYNDALSNPSMSSAQFLVGAAPGTYISEKK